MLKMYGRNFAKGCWSLVFVLMSLAVFAIVCHQSTFGASPSTSPATTTHNEDSVNEGVVGVQIIIDRDAVYAKGILPAEASQAAIDFIKSKPRCNVEELLNLNIVGSSGQQAKLRELARVELVVKNGPAK